jgi:hypothetical protein
LQSAFNNFIKKLKCKKEVSDRSKEAKCYLVEINLAKENAQVIKKKKQTINNS